MKQQVACFSLQQNGKVFAVLMAVTSLIFFAPFFLIFAASAPPPMLMLPVMPLMVLVPGYVMVAIGCAIYNFMFKYIGGIEFESKADGA